jgi:hypothetical protein
MTRRGSVRWVAFALIVPPFLGAGAGCTRSDGAVVSVVPEYDTDSGALRSLRLDADGDGRSELVASMDGGHVRVVQVDEDGDGSTDRWEYFERAAAGMGEHGSSQRLIRVEHLLRTDGVVRREAFEQGKLVWAREDRDHDGRDDRWETYRNGALVSVAIDTTGSGRPDRTLRYD